MVNLQLLLHLPDRMPSDDTPERHTELELESYSMMELVWHLCEILFLELLPAGCLVQQLLEWIRWHGRREDESVRTILTHRQPDEHPSYWTEVYSLVLSGCVEPARDLLQHHSLWHSMPQVGCRVLAG